MVANIYATDQLRKRMVNYFFFVMPTAHISFLLHLFRSASPEQLTKIEPHIESLLTQIEPQVLRPLCWRNHHLTDLALPKGYCAQSSQFKETLLPRYGKKHQVDEIYGFPMLNVSPALQWLLK